MPVIRNRSGKKGIPASSEGMGHVVEAGPLRGTSWSRFLVSPGSLHSHTVLHQCLGDSEHCEEKGHEGLNCCCLNSPSAFSASPLIILALGNAQATDCLISKRSLGLGKAVWPCPERLLTCLVNSATILWAQHCHLVSGATWVRTPAVYAALLSQL